MTLDVGLCEILPFEEKRFRARASERIGKAVAKIQTGGVAALAILAKGLSRNVRLIHIDSLERNLRLGDQQIEVAHSVRAITLSARPTSAHRRHS
jgi:hypothetical protein